MSAMSSQLVLVILSAILSFIGGVLVWQFRAITKSIDNISSSVSELNKKIAVVINTQDWHMREIEDIKHKIERDSE